MRKFFIAAISAALLLTSASLSAQDSTSQTRPKVLPDFDLPILDKVKHRNENGKIEFGNFGFGPIFNDSKDPFDFNQASSFELFLYDTDALVSANAFSVSCGFGLDWKNFKLTGSEAMSKATDSSIILGPYPEGSTPRLSKITVFSLSFPVLASVNFNGGLGFSFGPVFNWNVGSRIKTKYKIGDEKFKDVYKDAHCNPLSIDLMGELHLNKISLFVKYSPMPVMDKSYLPEFQHLSLGLAIPMVTIDL